MILMIERSMAGFGGHEETQLNAIATLSGERGVKVVTTTDFVAPTNDTSFNIFPIFSPRKEANKAADQTTVIQNDAGSLQSFLEKHNEADIDLIVVPSAYLYEIQMTLAFYRLSNCKIPSLIRVLRNDFVANISPEDLVTIRELIDKKLLSIHTETIKTSQWLNQHYNLNTTPKFVLPCSLLPETALDKYVKPDTGASRTLTIGVLGGLRREKGKLIIPDIVRDLRGLMQKELPDIELKFVIQNHRHSRKFIGNMYYDIRMALKLLPTLFLSKNIEVIKEPGYLTQEAFLSILETIDILIVPYDLGSYQYRGSGIIIDGVLALKPFVFTHGIGASEFLEFGNAEPARSPKEFATKIVKVVKNIQDYRQNTVEARNHLLYRIGQSSEVMNKMSKEK